MRAKEIVSLGIGREYKNMPLSLSVSLGGHIRFGDTDVSTGERYS